MREKEKMEAAGEMKGEEIRCGRGKKGGRGKKVMEKTGQRERNRRQRYQMQRRKTN